MPVASWDSNEARIKWREVIDTAATGMADVVITRYGKPVVAVIDYAAFVALQEELDDLRAARRADAAFEEYLYNSAAAQLWEEIRARLAAEGRLDVAE